MYTPDFIVDESEISDIDSPLVAFPESRHAPRRGKPTSFASPRVKRIRVPKTTQGPSPSRGTSAGGQSPDVARIYLSRNRQDSPGRVSASVSGGGAGVMAQTSPPGVHPAGYNYIPSRIPEDMKIVKQVMSRDKEEAGFLNPETNMWNTVVFPRQFPDSREDVNILEGWMHQHMDNPALFKSKVASAQCESASEFARHQLYILDLAHFELVRQVSLQCSERGRLMHSIWGLTADLYNTVIREQQSVMQGLHRRVLDAVAHSEQLEEQMNLMKQAHKEQVAELLANSEIGKKEKENSAFRRLQQDMLLLERDNKIMEASLSDLSVWFPNFHLYSNSILRRLLPDVPLELETPAVSEDSADGSSSLALPQNRLFRDLKRIEMMELGFQVALEGSDGTGDRAGAGSNRGATPHSRGSPSRGTSADFVSRGSSRPASGRADGAVLEMWRPDSSDAEGIKEDRLDAGGAPKSPLEKGPSDVRSMTFSDTFLRSGDASATPPPSRVAAIVNPPSKNMRAIIYENQIQKLAIQDYEVKLKKLEFKSSRREDELKGKVLALQQQLRGLSSLVTGDEDSAGDGAVAGRSAVSGASRPPAGLGATAGVIVLSRPFPEHRPALSVAEELTLLADLLAGKADADGAPASKGTAMSTPALIPVAEIQRVFQSFFNDFALQLLPSNMVCGSSSAHTGLISGSLKKSQVAKGIGLGRAYTHSSAFDLSLSTVEAYILSQWNLHAKLSVRDSREKLKSLMWSIMVWLQSSAASYYYSGSRNAAARPVAAATTAQALENTVISVNMQEELPRSAEENEKAMLLSLSILLSVRYRRPLKRDKTDEDGGNRRAAVSAGLAAAKKMVPGPVYPLRDQIYAQVFSACYCALQRYMKCNTKLYGSHVAGSNVMEKAARCPVPTSHIRRVIKRVIMITTPCVFHVPKNALVEYYKMFKKENDSRGNSATGNTTVVNSDGTRSSGDDDAGRQRQEEDKLLARKLQSAIDLGKSRPWYFQMPAKRFEKILSDCMTLSYKDAGLSCDSYDVIAVVWDNVAEYHDDIKKALSDLFAFANAVSGGSLSGFMFMSIVTNVLEVSESLLGPLKSALALDWISAASVDKLNAEYFAQSILASGALLTGLHPLFENTSETKAELFMALRHLFDKLLAYDSVREAMANFDDGTKKENRSGTEASAEAEEEEPPLEGTGNGVTADETAASTRPQTAAREDGLTAGDDKEQEGESDERVENSADANEPPNSAKPAKRISRLSTLNVPDIGSLMTRCQMCLESIFGSVETSGGESAIASGFGGGTVPLSQVYFCYRSLEFLITHFGPEFDYQNVLTLEQEAIANRYRRTVILKRVYRVWAACVENGGAVYVQGASDDDAIMEPSDSESEEEGNEEGGEIVQEQSVASIGPARRRVAVNSKS